MKLFKRLFNRMYLMIILVLLEILIVAGLIYLFNSKVGWIETILRFIGAGIVFYIIRHSRHLSSDMMWIVLIMIFPIPGTAAYLFLGANLISSRTFRNLVSETEKAKVYYIQDESVLNKAFEKDSEMKGQFAYISQTAGFPFYQNTGFDYYPTGEAGYPVMLEELRRAERYIFMEYFIIEPGKMWSSFMEIFEQKIMEGVEIRIMYDDMGSMNTLPLSFVREMESKGIKCMPFNRINPVIGVIMNHRDHRKIMVIDGKVAFSGGINIADEYINLKLRFGYWKDNVIRITGPSVWSYTVMFLTNWNALRHEDDDYSFYSAIPAEGREDGFISPYGETPLDGEITAQNIYMNIVNQANNYCYIATPYLIIDTEFTNALVLAAKRGVDVCLITPGIPDKKIIYAITRSYYEPLLAGGVKIYEYTPGFIHSKVFVADDSVATVGTVNLDYRSLYLHFENGTYLYGSKKIADIKKDMTDTIGKSARVYPGDIPTNIFKEAFLSVIRLFTPLM